MMMNKLAFVDKSGRVNIVYATDKANLIAELGDISDTDYLSHVRKVSVPSDASLVTEIDESLIPNTNDFRDAWTLQGNPATIVIEATKAKAIFLQDNAQRFARLKIQLSNATDLGDDVSDLAHQIQGIQQQRAEIRKIDPSSSTAVQDLLALLHQQGVK